MKIILIDNFNRESISDKLIAENIDRIWANRIVDLLKEKYSGVGCCYFFRAVEDSYKLDDATERF